MKGWYYKAFGLEVGPVSMEILIDQIKDRSLSREDEVRFGENGQWRRIGSIGSLMTHLPFVTPATLDLDADRPSAPAPQTQKSSSQSWYYKSLGLEVGPVAMEKLIELIHERSLSREDEVRFGADGNWRRIGSIGPLMTHLPFETSPAAVPTNSMGTTSQNEVVEDAHPNTLLDSLELNSLDDFEQEELTINHTALSKTSRTVGSNASSNSIAEPEPAESVSVPDLWWCTVQGKEYGPIELQKLKEWAATGRLRRDDYIRRGMETYVLANDVPGFFPELPNATKSETKASMDTVVQPVISNPSAKKGAISKSSNVDDIDIMALTENVDTPPKVDPKAAAPKANVEKSPALPPVVETPEKKPAVSAPPRPSSPSPSARPSFASTPAPVARTPSYPAATKSASRSSGMDFGGLMKILLPVGIGVGAIAVVGALIYFGSSMIPANTARQGDQYQKLNAAYTDFAKSRDKAAQKKMQDVTSPIVDELDKIQNRTASQTNVIRLAKKLLQISKEELATTKSKNEMEAETLLKIASNGLGLKQ